MYADVTCLLINGNDLHTLIRQLNIELQYVFLTSSSTMYNTLSLNTKKTIHKNVHTTNTDHHNMDVIMDHSTPTKVVSRKYLGVIVEHKSN